MKYMGKRECKREKRKEGDGTEKKEGRWRAGDWRWVNSKSNFPKHRRNQILIRMIIKIIKILIYLYLLKVFAFEEEVFAGEGVEVRAGQDGGLMDFPSEGPFRLFDIREINSESAHYL